jgi:hypothetical protein
MSTWKKLLASVVLILMAAFVLAPATQAATSEEIEASIQNGLNWLVSQVSNPGYPENPKIAFAMLKLVDRARELGKDPFQNDSEHPDYYEYADEVIAGFNYIFEGAVVNGEQVHWAYDDFHCTYDTGIKMMAIAAAVKTGDRLVAVGPLVGKSYTEVLEMAMNYMTATQLADGGWGYGCDYVYDRSDNSNAGYATLGLGYAQDVGVTIPASVLGGIDSYINSIQCKAADSNYGGSGYTSACEWVNILKTGNLLFEMALVGDTMTAIRAQEALAYIENQWNDAGGGGTGWMNHRQAMFTMMKGLVAMGIEEITVDGNPVDWFDVVSSHLVATQNFDGSWPDDPWGDQFLSTVWALLTLEKTVVIPQLTVPFDIKPTSCPNPFNFKSKGVMPAAILGTDELDVTTIDPASLKLVLAGENGDAEVLPLRWALEDVAAPYMNGEECGCTTAGPDGYMDLTIKFKNQDLAAMLEGYQVGDVVPLAITGNLMEEYGGTPIRGQDCVVVRQ